MKYALYGLVAAGLMAISSGCASNCCGPINGSMLGDGCSSGCGRSALDTLFGGAGSGCGGCTDVGAVASLGSDRTNVDSGCSGACGGVGCAGCVGAPIVNSPRHLANVRTVISDGGFGTGLGADYGEGQSGFGRGLGGGAGLAAQGIGPPVEGCECASCLGLGPGRRAARLAAGSVVHATRAVANLPRKLHHGAAHGKQGQVIGPTMGMVQYPYYTTRGPRDFFLANPPSIGP